MGFLRADLARGGNFFENLKTIKNGTKWKMKISITFQIFKAFKLSQIFSFFRVSFSYSHIVVVLCFCQCLLLFLLFLLLFYKSTILYNSIAKCFYISQLLAKKIGCLCFCFFFIAIITMHIFTTFNTFPDYSDFLIIKCTV